MMEPFMVVIFDGLEAAAASFYRRLRPGKCLRQDRIAEFGKVKMGLGTIL